MTFFYSNMKARFLILLFACISIHAAAQQKDTVLTLDQLRAPSSPAFNMLGISANEIERPKNPTDLALSLGNATNNFSGIPQSYAIEVAPFWILGGKTTFDQFIKDSVANNILQTAVISLGTATANSIKDGSQYRQVGAAVKFSILRGNVGDEFKTWKTELIKYQAAYTRRIDSVKKQLMANDEVEVKQLRELYNQTPNTNTVGRASIQAAIRMIRDATENKLDQIELELQQTKDRDLIKKLDKLSKTTFKRYGFKMDWAAGAVVDHPDSTFNRSYLSKFATWLTAGYEAKDGSNILFLLRYAANFDRFYRNNANQIVKDINIGNLDMGLRVFKDFNDKFTLSFEYINRIPFYSSSNYVLNNVTWPSRTDRYDVSLNYKVGKNQSISFTYGKNFDNIITKGGNLITALNYVIGFGSSRGVTN